MQEPARPPHSASLLPESLPGMQALQVNGLGMSMPQANGPGEMLCSLKHSLLFIKSAHSLVILFQGRCCGRLPLASGMPMTNDCNSQSWDPKIQAFDTGWPCAHHDNRLVLHCAWQEQVSSHLPCMGQISVAPSWTQSCRPFGMYGCSERASWKCG